MRYLANSKIVSRCCEVFCGQGLLCCVLRTVLHDILCFVVSCFVVLLQVFRCCICLFVLGFVLLF